MTRYAGRYADPGVVITFAVTSEGLEGSTEMNEQSSVPVGFLAEDMGVSYGQRVPCAMRRGACSGSPPVCGSCRGSMLMPDVVF